MIAGGRVDFHNLYGTFLTPRLLTRYQISDNTAIRLAIGRGYRVGNPVIENINTLVSNRQLVVTEHLDPEISWNMGGSITSTLPVGGKKIDLIGDYFYTTFENQLIYLGFSIANLSTLSVHAAECDFLDFELSLDFF